MTPLYSKSVEWFHSYGKNEEWLLSTAKVKSDSSLHQLWRVTPLYSKSEESPLYKSDSSLWKKWRVTALYGKSEEWHFSSTSIVKSDSSLRQKWRVTPLYSVEWLLPTEKVKSNSSLHQLWRVTPLFYINCEEWHLSSTSIVKSDSSLQ